MAGGARSGDDDDLITDINVTPLVDVVLVLLIILMVTATAIVSKTIPMELPKAATGEQTPSTLAVSIDQSGQVFLDTIPVTAEELRTQVRAARENDADIRAVIRASSLSESVKARSLQVFQRLAERKHEQETPGPAAAVPGPFRHAFRFLGGEPRALEVGQAPAGGERHARLVGVQQRPVELRSPPCVARGAQRVAQLMHGLHPQPGEAQGQNGGRRECRQNNTSHEASPEAAQMSHDPSPPLSA